MILGVQCSLHNSERVRSETRDTTHERPQNPKSERVLQSRYNQRTGIRYEALSLYKDLDHETTRRIEQILGLLLYLLH
jgi:hypothetical protein